MLSFQSLPILPFLFRVSESPSLHHARRNSSADMNLVILPLGDSITYGTDSTDGNGYRLDLQSLLEPATTHQQYIGSIRSGSMADNYNEGHPGFTITQIAAETPQDFLKDPNVVLLMAGTNDVLQNLSISEAPTRLGNLVDQLIAALPNTCVLLATLTPLLDPSYGASRESYNAAIPSIVNDHARNGNFVILVNMSSVPSSEIDPADGIHPDDAGYKTMAETWYAGIMEAKAKGWITASNDTDMLSVSRASSMETATPTQSALAISSTARQSLGMSLSASKLAPSEVVLVMILYLVFEFLGP